MSLISRLLTPPLFLWSFISLSLFSSASLVQSPAGSRGLQRRAIRSGGNQPDFVVDLNVTNFDAVLKDTSAPFAVVEFFAHGSRCRVYTSQYGKVARLFNGVNAVHPGIILVTRVDCAYKVNTKLCDKFNISDHPSLFWGPSSRFVGGSWDGKNEKSEIRYLNGLIHN
ncbi:hypothetical protein LXL04_025040 [Taraxacum kok-saghyz]